ncbi:hypothetical protein M0638_27970 [Roseomonas sp. NAR14]|uniref:Uncharacterized protein n=1 Tax=Roseomonas acroporae TaxID=2937791 RepID=A0A9X1YLK5_9PROT|nr:hypothetical protein [Roseomonas acroporae]MCK8788191.1 hypothetical protein [Roseomonas acroporae]
MSDSAPAWTTVNLDEFFAARGVKAACPLCGNESWYNLGRLKGETWAQDYPGANPPVRMHRFLAYALSCTNCGFIRSHFAQTVEGLLAPPGAPERAEGE